MQKVINALALLSFLGTASIIGGGVFIYLQKDALIDGVKEQVTKHATEAITNALPGMLDGAMPELPEVTGGAMPTGGDTPGVPAGLPGL